MNIIERSEGRYYVESRTAGWRHVKRIGEDGYTCDCEDNLYRFPKDCRHIQAVKSR